MFEALVACWPIVAFVTIGTAGAIRADRIAQHNLNKEFDQ